MSQFNNTKGKRFNLVMQTAVKVTLCSLTLSFISCGHGQTKKQDMRQAPAKSQAPLTKNPPEASKPSSAPTPSANVETKSKTEGANQTGSTATPPPKFSLEGQWQKPCEKDDDGQSAASSTIILGNQEVSRELNFSDDNCQTLILAIDVKAVVTIGQPSTKVPEAYEVDRALTQALLTPMSQEMADALNEEIANDDDPTCASIKFEAKVTQDVTQCHLFPKIQYDIAKRSGDLMWTGNCDDEGACETKETRATNLETTFATRLK